MSDSLNSPGGLPRTVLAGSGHTLMDAFARLRASHRLTTVVEHQSRQLVGARMLIGREEGRGYWDFYDLAGSMYIVLCDFQYPESHSELIPGEGLLEFHIKLTGSLSLQFGRQDPLRVTGPALLIWNQPAGCGSVVASEPGTHDRSLSLYCRPSFFRDSIIGDDSQLPFLFRNLLRDDLPGIDYARVPLSLEIIEAAQSLFDVPLTNPISLVFVEGKALELTYRIVSAFETLTRAADERYSKEDMKRFNTARELIENNHCPPPKIGRLARTLGINRTKLTRGFKSVFGVTIFDYATCCRMRTALRLLRESDAQIGFIAESLGYKHQTTFTAAYKRCYGVSPKDARKSLP